MHVVFNNKRLLHDFDIVAQTEAGIVLEGWEVKSLKHQQAQLSGSFIDYEQGNLWLKGATIYPWKAGFKKTTSAQNRDRKLLVKRREAEKLGGLGKRPGYTILPVKVYENNQGLVKVEIAVVKGKKKTDKRKRQKELDLDRQMQRDKKYRI